MVGISYCHGRGVFHRDLKPENLLLDANFALKIADFGFAAIGEAPMMCQSIVGSKTYMAPEVLGRRSITFTHLAAGYDGSLADVWSAGVILFTMLAGHPPMEQAAETDWWFRALKLGRQDLFWQSHEGNTRPFPEEAKDLISSMLMVDPAERITVPHIMHHPYLAPPAAACRSGGGMFSRHTGQPVPAMDPSAALVMEMQRRYEMSMACKRLCTVESSSRGTADSAGASRSGSPTSATTPANPDTARGMLHGPYGGPFSQFTHRALDDGDASPPEMSAADAMRVTNGFMANGHARDVVKALETELFDMGAEIEGVGKDGTRAILNSFKVSAAIPAVNKIGGGKVAMVAMVYRVSREGGRQNVRQGGPDKLRNPGEAELVVVLKRRGGHYHRYRKMEDTLISRLTTTMDGNDGGGDGFVFVNMSPTP
ncbi:unnamed protein product [Laminaria digitata]